MKAPKITRDEKDSEPIRTYMGVSKNSGTPKWMIYNGKPY